MSSSVFPHDPGQQRSRLYCATCHHEMLALDGHGECRVCQGVAARACMHADFTLFLSVEATGLYVRCSACLTVAFVELDARAQLSTQRIRHALAAVAYIGMSRPHGGT